MPPTAHREEPAGTWTECASTPNRTPADLAVNNAIHGEAGGVMCYSP